MIASILAAAVLGGPAAPADFKPPEWVRKPTPEDLSGLWPMAARDGYSAGDVVMTCEVDVQGEAKDCQVLSETPQGVDFGWAASKMPKLLHFSPATSQGQPIPWRVTIPIHFGAPPPPIVIKPDLIAQHPVWLSAPTFADVAAAYPKTGVGVIGVSFLCTVRPSGTLSQCPGSELMPDKGALAVARALVPRFRMVVDPAATESGRPLRVLLTIRMISPSSPEFVARRLGAPDWSAGLDPTAAQKLFPAEAAAKGLTTGLGLAHCVVAPDGALTACEPRTGDPDGLGFSEAAVRVAQAMRMNLWTGDGGPVDGAAVNLPIRFNLKGAAPAAK